ncbi:hypothetical protein KIL84_013186 [Mauremys mutica]|uniref:Uncharacterized protein n=1 Tax=Mauremys mutica TaxID=74926 RepID=A0A9D3WWS7_9SAUR|nr:hypothetical protein KIL84_013186 [Mauremys mutica]
MIWSCPGSLSSTGTGARNGTCCATGIDAWIGVGSGNAGTAWTDTAVQETSVSARDGNPPDTESPGPGTKRKAYSSPSGQLTPISKEEEEEERPRKTRGLACVRDMDEAALRKDVGILFPALHSMVCHLPREHLEERREALDSLIHLARLFLVELLVFLFRRLNKDEEEETCASLLILDQIVRSNISEMTQHTEKLFIALGPILQSTSIRVREALAYLIRTMGAHGLLEKPDSRPLIDFLVRQCTLPLDSTEAADGRHTMELEVRQLCSSTLQSLGDSPRMANEPASIEQLRSLLLLTYGHVVHSGPTDLILETIGYKILSPMQKHYFLSPHEILRGKDRARLQSPNHKCALLAISYIGKFQPHLSKEQVAETISTCVTSYMIQRPALVKLRGTQVAESSAIRAETFLEQHLTPTTLLHLFLAIWRFLGADPMLTREVLHILLDDSPEKGWANPGQTQDRSCPQPDRLPPATTYGLWELIGALGQGDTLEGHEDDLFASCFLAIASPPAQHLLGVQQDWPSDTSPRSMAVQALARVLRLRGSQPAVELMDQEQGWQLLEEAQPEGFTLLSRAIVSHPNLALKSIPQLLLPSLQASQEGERMACTALFAEFLGSPLLMENEPKAMRKQVLKAMLQQTQDSNIHIRGRALHGLRNAVTAFPDKVRKKQEQILASFVHGVCQSCDPCAILDATEGLCWMLRDPKAPLKAHVAVPLAMQARTFFEDENNSLRRASIELFGQLSKFVSKRSSRFGAEVEKSMGTLLIHLQDGDPQVAQACRVALLHCAPFLSYQPLRTLVRSQLAEGAAPVIPTFLSEACRTLVSELWGVGPAGLGGGRT